MSDLPPKIIPDSQKIEIQGQWVLVESAQGHINGLFLNSNFSVPSPQAIKFIQNLRVVLAFSVLELVLKIYKQGGAFQAPNEKLQVLMSKSQSCLAWKNYNLVDEGRDKRNKLVHQRLQMETAKAQEYINAIKTELIFWNVINE